MRNNFNKLSLTVIESTIFYRKKSPNEFRLTPDARLNYKQKTDQKITLFS